MMASRMKRIFHRRKDDDSSQAYHSDHYPPGSQQAFQTSLYNTTVADNPPQVGHYPIKGSESSIAVQQQGRKSSVRSRRSSGSVRDIVRRSLTPDRHTGQQEFRTTQSPPDNHPFAQYSDDQRNPTAGSIQTEERKRWSHSQLPQEIAKMNIGGSGPSAVTETTTTTHFSSKPNGSRTSPRNAKYQPLASANIRPVADSISQDVPHSMPRKPPTINNPDKAHGPTGTSQTYDNRSQQHLPVHRKQARHISTGPSYTANKEPMTSQRRSDAVSANRIPTILPAHKSDQKYNVQPTPKQPAQQTAVQAQFIRSSQSDNIAKNAQAVVDRAQTNTRQTDVVESVAPPITQETVHRKIHHLREERITQDIHEHDVYHRILPVIDVEVLPARHFLPVEGGGLVEVGADEVPGRGNHWVVAETASKIPSGSAPLTGVRRFSAREFSGRAGDSKKYITPEGYERTEQSWVHPPELETGARDTGQSWPMVFGEDRRKEVGRGQASPNGLRKHRDLRRRSS